MELLVVISFIVYDVVICLSLRVVRVVRRQANWKASEGMRMWPNGGTFPTFAWWYWGSSRTASRRGRHGCKFKLTSSEYRRRLLPHRTVRCINDYDNNNNNGNNINKMSRLCCFRLGFDTCCSLVGGILHFGAHTGPVFRINLPTKLSATRCQNQQYNRINSSVLRTLYLAVVVTLLPWYIRSYFKCAKKSDSTVRTVARVDWWYCYWRLLANILSTMGMDTSSTAVSSW